MVIDYEEIHSGLPSRKPQFGPSPTEGDKFFIRLQVGVARERAREQLRDSAITIVQRPYVDPTEFEDGEAD